METEEKNERIIPDGERKTLEDGINTVSFRHKTLEERITEYDGQHNLDGEFDWGEPVGREIW